MDNTDIEKSLKIIQANIRRKIFTKRKSSASTRSSRSKGYSVSTRSSMSKGSSVSTRSSRSKGSSVSTRSSRSEGSSKSVFLNDIVEDDKKFKNVNKISKFLKSKLIVNKYTLDNRVYFLNYIKNNLREVRDDDCLEKKQFNDRDGYTIRNIINLEKIISKDNFNGEIYKTSVKNSLGVFPIATKVMKTNASNLFEISLMNKITDEIIMKKISKHFLIIYRSCLCKKEGISEKSSLISVNEIANGDLASLLNNPEIISDNELLYNILFQTFISIATFHNLLSNVHNDCHGGNFLWHYNNEKGYYHYIFNGMNIYLKACKYNIMIYDFGLVEKINKNNSMKVIKDYCEIIPTFLNENYDSDENEYSPDDDFKMEMNDIMILLMNILNTIKKNTKTSSRESPTSQGSSKTKIQEDVFNILFENVFMKNKGNILKTEANKSMNIINSLPYYINNT
jgi:hypothetical protein